MPKLTKSLVESIDPQESGRIVWDDAIPGFGVRVGASGKRVYIVKYRDRERRQRKLRIGTHGALTVQEARKIATQRLAAIARGENPAAELQAARQMPSIRDLGIRYLTDHAEPHKRASSINNDRRLINTRINPALGRLAVNTVERADVLRLHRSLRDKPYEANRVLSLLSKMFKLAELWDLRPDGSNPCRHVQRFKEEKRERFLSTEELARLGQALSDAEGDGSEGPHIIACIRLLIFTGCRLSEILTLTWDEVDFEGQCLRLSTSKTGAKVVHLGAPAQKVLAGIERKEDNPYVIPGRRRGSHLVNLQKPWRRIRARADLLDVRLHDLRHTFASFGAGGGLSLPMIGKMLGHTQPQTTQRYAHLAADPIKQATEKVSGDIASAMKPRRSQVVPISSSRPIPDTR